MKGRWRVEIVSITFGALSQWIPFMILLLTRVGTQRIGANEPYCPIDEKCSNMSADCWDCTFPSDCKYGETTSATCQVKKEYDQCKGDNGFTIKATCMYCYQTDPSLHICDPVTNCSVTAPPPDNLVQTKCTVDGRVVCMGRRHFRKRVPCQWTSGRYKWSTALILSITLGGFGADRFYLGLWRSGLGKLFSFGGLGVWTIIDVILIAVGYVGPADNSLYLY